MPTLVADALSSPAEFFTRPQSRSLRAAGTVVLLSGVVLLVAVLPLLWLLRHVLPPDRFVDVVGLTVALMPAYAVVRWLLLAATVYATGRLVGGEGRFRDLLAYLGWGFLPNVLLGGVLTVAVVAVVAGVDPPTSEAALAEVGEQVSQDPRVTLAAGASLVRAEAGVSLSGLQRALGTLQFAWNAYVWFAAAKVGLSLDDRRALVAVAVPVVFTAVVVGHPNVDFGVGF